MTYLNVMIRRVFTLSALVLLACLSLTITNLSPAVGQDAVGASASFWSDDETEENDDEFFDEESEELAPLPMTSIGDDYVVEEEEEEYDVDSEETSALEVDSEEVSDADSDGWTTAVDRREPVVLVVAPPVFEAPLQRWIEYRQEQGYKILLLSLARKDEDGLNDHDVQLRPVATPDEIRMKIRQAAESYQIEAILLVGDGAPTENAAYGWRDVVPAPRVPALVVQIFGSEDLLASDAFYADLDDDGIPDAPIGRLPAETPEELATCIDKIIRYERESTAGNWTRRINVVAGPNGLDLRTIGSDPNEPLEGANPFSGLSNLVSSIVDKLARKLFSDYLPQEFVLSLTQFSTQSVFCPYPADFGATVLQRINEGSLFFVYLGHGRVFGLDRYAAPSGMDYGVFEQEDCKKLNSAGHSPVAMFFACYTCAYDASWRSLGEEMALHPNGPVAVLGASRVTAPYGMCFFGSTLLESAFGYDLTKGANPDRKKTLGAVYLEAQRRTLTDSGENESFEEELDFADDEQEEAPPEDPMAPGAQLYWLNKRLNKSLADAEKIKRQNASFRKNIDQAAAFFDPTANRLKDQLRDHIAEFNLLGDPLLQVKFPVRVPVDAPEVVYSTEEVELVGVLPLEEGTEAIVQGELLLADFRPNVSRPKRDKTFRESPEARAEFNETYRQANEFVVDAVRTKTKNGEFCVRIKVPANYSGESVVRIAGFTDDNYYIGSKKILVRPQSTPASR